MFLIFISHIVYSHSSTTHATQFYNKVIEECKTAAIAGHTIIMIILGQADTGKTTLINNIRSDLSRMGINVAMTAITGIASCLLFGGQTIHSYIGRFSAQHIVSELQYNDKKGYQKDHHYRYHNNS